LIKELSFFEDISRLNDRDRRIIEEESLKSKEERRSGRINKKSKET